MTIVTHSLSNGHVAIVTCDTFGCEEFPRVAVTVAVNAENGQAARFRRPLDRFHTLEPPEGIEPSTFSLRVRCSAD